MTCMEDLAGALPLLCSILDDDRLLEKNRTYPLPQARYILFAWLRDRGHTLMTIEAATGFSHSTVVYGLKWLSSLKRNPAIDPKAHDILTTFSLLNQEPDISP